MRLIEEELMAIRRNIYQRDSEAVIYLFGSRVDDNKRGGDIDLLVLSSKLSFRDARQIRLGLYDALGEQKIDLIIAEEVNTAFLKIAQSTGIRL